MGKKVFVSYKYNDNNVSTLDGYEHGTARDYVDYLQDHNFSGDDLNKAEHDYEDLSQFKDDTIKSKLRDKIWDSSVTLILISPNMMEANTKESDQWIPWEVSYSLRTETRNGYRSLPNGMLAIVLPDQNGDYSYFVSSETLVDGKGRNHNVRNIKTYNTFKIIRDNMFNQINPDTSIMQGYTVYFGDCSYIVNVTWDDFINDPGKFIDKVTNLKENKVEDYDLHKKLC